VIAVGHRGTVKFAPENKIAAHEAAIAMGARAIEMDVRMTKDGEFVIMHDASVDRTTDGSGLVSRMTLAEIKNLDAGSWFGADFAGERVPTLREALRNIKGRAGVDIDFKSGPENSAALIAQVLDEEGFDDGTLVTVFVRARHYRKMKTLPARYALRPQYVDERTTAAAARADGVEIMGLRRRNFSFAAARAIADNRLALFTNVMGDDDGDAGFSESLRAGARFIQTDRLDLLVPFLKERGLLADCVPARDLTCLDGADAAPMRLAAAAHERVSRRRNLSFSSPRSTD
jgi:glycerophosphoryl diester phosphodiesterase